MTKEYTYTRTIEIDFDYLIKEYPLDGKRSLKLKCDNAVHSYIIGLDDCDYFLIDNEEQIARDLYNYIQSKK